MAVEGVKDKRGGARILWNLFWGRAEMRGGFESEDPFFGGDWGEGLCYIESLTILEWEEIVKHRAVR